MANIAEPDSLPVAARVPVCDDNIIISTTYSVFCSIKDIIYWHFPLRYKKMIDLFSEAVYYFYSCLCIVKKTDNMLSKFIYNCYNLYTSLED